ncbi:hypothetical protein [Streptomyces sp. NPDC001268]|uniref:hypothetical protein n=1 Tax=Streptomyces sp. NPDC001268 TaxID=3364553 RepID=UPI003687D250
MTFLDTVRGHGRHRAQDRIRELKAAVADKSMRLQAADRFIVQLITEKSDALLDAKSLRQQLDCTEALVAKQLLQIQALRANADQPAARIKARPGNTSPTHIPGQRAA